VIDENTQLKKALIASKAVIDRKIRILSSNRR
jgi:hypothetical protein